MNETRMLLALRDVLDEDLRALSPEDEATPEEKAAMRGALASMYQRQLDFERARRPRLPPPRKPLACVLRAPAEPHWAVFRRLPQGVAPGVPVQPLHLHGRAAQYELHVGFSYVPASDWDGDVPAELAAAYTSEQIVVTAPGGKAHERESFPLLFSRARSIVFATHAPIDHLELDRIAKKLPPGDMREAAKQLHARHAPQPAQKFEKPEGFQSAKNRQHAARAKAIAAGEDPNESAVLAGFAPGAQQSSGAPHDLSSNSFGQVGTP